MNKRIWGVIIVILALAIIAGIVFFLFFYKPGAPEPAAGQPSVSGSMAAVAPTPEETPGAPASVQPLSPLKKPQIKSDDLARLAAAFAERFGSFSNQSDYGNLKDLQIFMTETMKTWAQNYMESARLKKTDTSIYYGIVTKAILSEVKQFDADVGLAEILVKTQRRESAGTSGNSSTFYQDIIIKYRREGTIWRADGVYWQTK